MEGTADRRPAVIRTSLRPTWAEACYYSSVASVGNGMMVMSSNPVSRSVAHIKFKLAGCSERLRKR